MLIAVACGQQGAALGVETPTVIPYSYAQVPNLPPKRLSGESDAAFNAKFKVWYAALREQQTSFLTARATVTPAPTVAPTDEDYDALVGRVGELERIVQGLLAENYRLRTAKPEVDDTAKWDSATECLRDITELAESLAGFESLLIKLAPQTLPQVRQNYWVLACKQDFQRQEILPERVRSF